MEYTVSIIIIDHIQAGFMKGRSMNDQIFILKESLATNWEYNMEILFIDFKKTYNSLNKIKCEEKRKNSGYQTQYREFQP